jgi:SAM-dependent methyltransferase
MKRKEHWDKVYGNKLPTELTWFQARPETSLTLIRDCGLGPEVRIIDVGSGTSLLPALLLEEGFRHLSILDASSKALELAEEQFGSRASEVEWFESDILDFEPPHRWELWHDRAVFHFLTSEEDQAAYCRVMNRALEPGGHVIIATFAVDGPTRCSGLDVVRHSPESLGEVLGEEYRLSGFRREAHESPTGAIQNFIYTRFQRNLEP